MDDTIGEMVRQRRKALAGADAQLDEQRRPWGLALSGGGIRSATFCLGLLKALAQGRQLLKFDILSTVSGGGYIGSTLGRLCSRARTPDEVRAVEGAFAEVDKVRFGWWLRSNGRYLIPGGLRDTLFAVSLYLRNLLGTHIEIAIAATLIGLCLATLNLLMWEGMASTIDLDNAQTVARPIRWATQVPTLWLAGVVPWALSIVLANAYWSVRDRPVRRYIVGSIALWAALGTGAWLLRNVLVTDYGGPAWLAPAFIGFAAAWVAALLWVLVRGAYRRSTAGVMRNELTDGLASMVYWMLLIALLGLLDRSAWWLAANTQEARVSYGGVLLVVAAGLRGVLPMLFSGKREAPGIGKKLLMSLASVFGLLVAFCLAAWWIGVLYAAVLLPVFTPSGLEFSRGWVWLGVIGVIVFSYAYFTGRNFSFLNVSSLHMFYKARIVRGYLGAANAARLGDDPTERVSGLSPPQVPVGQVHAGDDIGQLDYAPHRHGGPVHLINVCINQTHDSKQKLFNRDRRSLPLTIAPQGWMQAVGAPWAQARGDGAMSLGAWASISGAAFAPGLGRLTKRGIAALSVFAGLRLGYWWNSKEAGIAQPGAARRVSTFLMKTRFMLLECFGAFPGSGSQNWYLSDGGHFENTGAYALLRQEAELIVMADCGADPDYRFCDLENLIRRARIDLNADIVFLKPRGDAGTSWRSDFGSLNDLASTHSQACLALARIEYASGQSGHLVLVKPNVSADLPVDLVNFKAANPLFPQQATTDQFFDEAQWESYFQLGTEIGQRLGGELLARVAQGVPGLFDVDDGLPGEAVLRAGADGGVAGAKDGARDATPGALAAVSRLQARVLKAGAVTASLGLGTVATFAIAAWQGIDTWRTEQSEQQRAESLAFKDLTERWSKLRVNAPPGEAPASLAAELLRTGDLLCREGRENFMAKFRLSVRIVDDAKIACKEELANAAQAASVTTNTTATSGEAPARLSASPACARLLDPSNGIDCLQPIVAPPCAPRYWARDYTGRTPPQENCSGFGAGASSLVAAIWTRLRSPFEVRFREVGVPAVVVQGEPPSSGAAAGAPDAAPVPAPPPPVLIPGNACAGALVYLQIFGPDQRDAARALRAPWRALGASVPPIEDVLISSRAAGRAPPAGHPVPTIVYHGEAMKPCAQLLSLTPPMPGGEWALKPLAKGLMPTPGTIAVWLPRPPVYSQK